MEREFAEHSHSCFQATSLGHQLCFRQPDNSSNYWNIRCSLTRDDSVFRMSSTSIALPQDHVRALDTLRSRLAQLSTSITLLKQQLEHHETLPSWYKRSWL